MDHSNVITIGGQDIAIGDSTSTKKALPPGTTRNVFRGYEEVAVPAVDPGKLLPDEKLVEISELDGWAQSAFKGYKTLNRIQSRIFEVRWLHAWQRRCAAFAFAAAVVPAAALLPLLQPSARLLVPVVYIF